MSVQFEQLGSIKTRVTEYLPPFYKDSKVISDIFGAILPEIETILEFTLAVDENADFPNSNIRDEINAHLNNTIGWGLERLLYQFFIPTVNKQFEDFRDIYGAESDIPTYIDLRNRLKLLSKEVNTITKRDIINEVESNGMGFVNGIIETIASYLVSISITPFQDSFKEVLTERLITIMPAHLNLTIVFAGLRLSDSPQGKLSDVPQKTLGGL